MHNINNINTPTRRRATAQEREKAYLLWLEFYQKGLSPNEIVDVLEISEAQFKAYLRRAICSEGIQAVAPKYNTYRAKEFPKALQKQLGVEGMALVKTETSNDGQVTLAAFKPQKEVKNHEVQER